MTVVMGLGAQFGIIGFAGYVGGTTASNQFGYGGWGADLGAYIGVGVGGFLGRAPGAAVGGALGQVAGYHVGNFLSDSYNQLTNYVNEAGRHITNHLSSLAGNCFPATTKITLATGETTTIDKIKVGDEVLSFNPHFNSKNAPLVSAKVTCLFENVTQEWLQLSNGTTVTAGHLFLNEFGKFEMIGEIVERNGQIVCANDNYKIKMVA